MTKRPPFEVKIDSSHKKGSMTYGEYLIKGSSRKEILISSYICHPSLLLRQFQRDMSHLTG